MRLFFCDNNLWLTGRLDQAAENSNVMIAMKSIRLRTYTSIHSCDDTPLLTRDKPYHLMEKASKPLLVETGAACLGDPHAVLFRVSIVPESSQRWAPDRVALPRDC